MVPQTKSITAKKVATKATTEKIESKVKKSSKNVIKKSVKKRNVGNTDPEYREKVTNYENSKPGEAIMHCSFCVHSFVKKVFLGKGRNVRKHMFAEHGVHPILTCSYDTCTWACGVGLKCALEHFQKDHCYKLSASSRIDKSILVIGWK